MRKVAVLGIGSTPFGVLKDKSLKEIATTACNEALNDAGIRREQIQAFYLGNYMYGFVSKQESIASMVAENLGLKKEIEQASFSGGIAFRHGWLLVASGLCDFVLVAGVEKMSDLPRETITSIIASSMEWEQQGKFYLTFPGYFGIIAHRYMHEFKVDMDAIHNVSIKNRMNGVKNPRARFRKEITLGQIKSSRVIADPLRLYDCCPNADGAAAAVLGPADIAHKYRSDMIEILGCIQSSGHSSLYAIEDPTTISSTMYAAKAAFSMAGLTPRDIDVVELYDCFSINEIITSEDLGFFKKGTGAIALREGRTEMGGDIPINPSGGLLSKGHPPGATGLGQVYEMVKQLRGEHENQVAGARTGLIHHQGASSEVAIVAILRKRY
jgi:acetyl-CoA C-acetyltransferase